MMPEQAAVVSAPTMIEPASEAGLLSLSVSLVVYKPDMPTLEQTVVALQQAARVVKAERPVALELTLVDNSRDAEWHERLKTWVGNISSEIPDWKLDLLQAPGNIGYGRSNNLVIERVKSDYHLVINPDLFVSEDALREAIDFMAHHPDVGLLTPAVFGEDGERHYLCKRNPTLFIMLLRGFVPSRLRPFFRSRLEAFEMRDCDYEAQIEGVSYPTGCFMLFRTAFLHRLHGFDPDFFMYLEDADIGRRMLEIARVVYVPTVKVIHQWARGTHRSWKLRWVTVQSAFIYWKKWGGVI